MPARGSTSAARGPRPITIDTDFTGTSMQASGELDPDSVSGGDLDHDALLGQVDPGPARAQRAARLESAAGRPLRDAQRDAIAELAHGQIADLAEHERL